MLPKDVGTEKWFEVERMCVSGRLETLFRWRKANGKTDDMQLAVTNEILARDMEPTSALGWMNCSVAQIGKEMASYLKERHPDLLEDKHAAVIVGYFETGTLFSGDSFPIADIDRLHYEREPDDLAGTLVSLIKNQARYQAYLDSNKIGLAWS